MTNQKVQFSDWKEAAVFIAALLQAGSTATFNVYEDQDRIVLEFTGGF